VFAYAYGVGDRGDDTRKEGKVTAQRLVSTLHILPEEGRNITNFS